MGTYALKRILQRIPILPAITFLSFAMMRLAGSDAVMQKMENTGVTLSQEAMDAARKELGLDQPFLTQYARWLGGVLRGDMGKSYLSGEEVFSVFLSKLPATLLLAACSVFLTICISVPLGILGTVKQNSFADQIVRWLSFLGNSLPNFFVALLFLMYFFALRWPLFPVIFRQTDLQSVALPAFTLALVQSFCHRVLVMREGRVVEEGTPDQVIHAPASPYTRQLAEASLWP